tara:strand:- start:8343 stop:8516 length:174 start_codon:yes stop_codon:yes gene_type:complete
MYTIPFAREPQFRGVIHNIMSKEKEGKPKTGKTAASKTPKEKKAAKAAKKKGKNTGE